MHAAVKMAFRFKHKRSSDHKRNSSPSSENASEQDIVTKRGGPLQRQESVTEETAPTLQPLPGDETNKSDKHGYFVKLSLHSGHNLAVRDRSGTSDPYVKLKHKNYKTRSSTVYRNLNPVWNEEFGFKVRDLTSPILLKVYDKDSLTSDDFMGWGQVTLTDTTLGSMIPFRVNLTDRKSKESDLGYLQVSVCVSSINGDNECALQVTDSLLDQRHQYKKQVHRSWKSIVSITLLEGKGLPAMDQNGFSDPYCKFRLGSQKYRSNIRYKTLNPEWKEQFEMKLYEGESKLLYINVMDKDYLSSDDYIGSCKLDLDDYKVQLHHNITIPLQDSPGTIHLLLVITGIPAEEGEEEVMECASELYRFSQSLKLKRIGDVGILKITIIRADGLNMTSNHPWNPFCTVEVGQARLRTNTLYSDTAPQWNKTFYFHIKDIHNSIHLVLYNDMKNKDEQLGQIMIPLLRVESGITKEYQLKDKDCLQQTGTAIIINCSLVYNTLRAAVRTINPKETPVFEQEQQFKQKTLRHNVSRILIFVRPLMRLLQFIEYILSWKDKVLSSSAIVVYSVICYFINLWMIFVFVILAIIGCYMSVFVYQSQKVSDCNFGQKQRSFNTNESESDLSDYDDPVIEEVETKENKKGLRVKLRQLMGLLLIVQIYTGYVADGCERLKNLFRWSVPFLCWMIVLACVIASIVTYFIPLRYIVLLWGLNKLTKRLRKPNAISNQELLDFLSRSPTDAELAKWKELTH